MLNKSKKTIIAMITAAALVTGSAVSAFAAGTATADNTGYGTGKQMMNGFAEALKSGNSANTVFTEDAQKTIYILTDAKTQIDADFSTVYEAVHDFAKGADYVKANHPAFAKAVTDKYGEEKFAELVSEYAQSDCCDQAKLNENFSKLAKLGFSADSFDNAQKTDMSALTDGYCCYSIKLDEDSVNAADSPFYQAGAHIDNPTLNVYCFHTNGHVVPTHFALSDTDNIIGG